ASAAFDPYNDTFAGEVHGRIAIDNSGRCTVAGDYGFSTAQFGNFALPFTSMLRGYKATMDVDGTWIGVRSFTGSVLDMRGTSSGNVLLCGYFCGGTLDLGDTTLVGNPVVDNTCSTTAFIVQYAPTGTLVNALSARVAPTNHPTGVNFHHVLARPGGGGYVLGSHSGTCQFGNIHVPDPEHDRNFLATFDANGQWARVDSFPLFPGYQVDHVERLASDEILFSGNFFDHLEMYPLELQGGPTLNGMVGLFDPATLIWEAAEAVISPGPVNVISASVNCVAAGGHWIRTAGWFNGTATINGQSYSATGYDRFITLAEHEMTGIEEGPNEAVPAILIGPNPAQQRVDCTLPDGITLGELYLTDAQGRVVRSMRITGRTMQLDIAQLAAGTYVIVAGPARGRFVKD
ncbi:MAG TPA: T9SS type A sorting domain-containing protein, partial [Flavobacteriales bacterium]|nr:T9SS type A sorting domain-containing protein [Flavobacteriales bacterium]